MIARLSERRFATQSHPWAPLWDAAHMTDAHHPWSDQPITGAAQDGFGRSGYARRAADLVANSRSQDESAVFGLTGPWGSGKTSLINMILENLQAAHPEWKIARFTPWSSADVPGLLSEFYASLAAALPPDRGNAVKQSLAALLEIAAPTAKLIPFAGDAASSAMVTAGQALVRTAPWDAAFKKATEKLREVGVPLLVIADDVDRLQADELMALLKVVRLLGRFPGVQYLLAYDDETLTQTLATAWRTEIGSATAKKFMEKIVQYPLVVPPLLDHQLVERFDEGIDQVLDETGRPPLRARRLSNLLDVLPALLPTPRAVDRLLAQLRHYLILLEPEEINDEDVILLALVRTSFPHLYMALPRWKFLLIQGHSGEMEHDNNSSRWKPADWNRLFRMVPVDEVEVARRLLSELFPKTSEDKYRLTGDQEGRRICDEDYFDRYFAMSILKSDVSDSQVIDVLDNAKKGHRDALVTLFTDQTRSRAALAIGKAIRLATFNTSIERFKLLSMLSGILGELDASHHVLMSDQSRVLLWMAEIIAPLGRDVSAEEILEVLSSTSLALRLQVWERVFDRLRDERARPPWVAKAAQVMGDEAVGGFVEHLRARDDAPLDEPTAYYVRCAVKFGRADHLRGEVVKTLQDSGAALEDLAARMVSRSWVMGADIPPELSGINQDLWAAVAPGSDDPWYRMAIDASVDPHGVSWDHRRRYARGRAERPSRGEAVETDVSATDEEGAR